MRSAEDARFLRAVGAEFQAVRLDRGWSLRLTAERSGMSAAQLSKIERGDRTGYNVVYLWRLTRGLGVPPASVLDVAVAGLIRRQAAERRLRPRRPVARLQR